MRKLPSIIARLLAGLAGLLLGACFDVREEIWIHRDGSGRAELTYTLPASALRIGGGAAGIDRKIREWVASEPKLRLDGLQVIWREDEAEISVKISTDSLRALGDLEKCQGRQTWSATAEHFVGDPTFQRRGLEIEFTRTIDVGGALGLASLGIGAEDRLDRRLTYIIHLPRAAKESNASAIENGGRTLIWDATLGEALKAPLVTRFRARIPLPWYAYAGAGLLLISIAAVFLRFSAKRRRKSA